MRATIEAVASRALGCDYKIWGFGVGMALLGLLRAGATFDRPEWTDAVADLVAPTLLHNMAARPTDHLIPVEVLAELHRLRPTTGVAASIHRFVRAVWRDEAPVPTHRPDLPDLADTVWVDCMHTDGPGLRVAGRPAAAASAIALAWARLQDVTGLFSHSYADTTARANDVHWGRGQGWALHGLVCLDDTGSRSRADRLLEALARVELDGRWRSTTTGTSPIGSTCRWPWTRWPTGTGHWSSSAPVRCTCCSQTSAGPAGSPRRCGSPRSPTRSARRPPRT